MATSIVCLGSVYDPLSISKLDQIRAAELPNPLATPAAPAHQQPASAADGTLSASAVFSAVAVASTIQPKV